MYNLTVATAHTFYVGSGQWLVHNQSCLTPSVVKDFAKNLPTMTRQDIIAELQKAGLTLKGQSPNGQFMEFVDASGRVRVKIHPPDKVTTYDHVHLYDGQGRPLNQGLKPDNTRSPATHIPIK